MKEKESKKFNSKILLFGEYILIKGSMALSIPFEKYTGQLLLDEESINSKSNHYSVAYLDDYFNFLKKSGFENQINLKTFNHDIQHGLIFETNIPISYGLGSSGAIVASIYDTYAFDKSEKLDELKDIFSKMESYYHGKSSGLDPLVSFLNKSILILEDGRIKTVSLPQQNHNNNSGIFLLDTKSVGETQPLVNWFFDKYRKDNFRNKIESTLIPTNKSCIKNYLSGDFNSLLEDVKSISRFTIDNFKPMIPESIEEIWENGLKTDDYYLKLCGSGGGGMMLGFASDLQKTLGNISEFETQIIMRY